MNRFLVETRTELVGNTLAGTAAVFGALAHLPNHWEALAPTAFDEALKSSDVRALFNHDPSSVLGRQSAGTLRLATDAKGLRFEVDLPDTSYANDLRALVERGDVTGMSFGFVPGRDTWTKAKDGRQLRTHTSVAKLVDVSPVTFPAYEGTELHLRAYDFAAVVDNRSRLIRARARVTLGRDHADVR